MARTLSKKLTATLNYYLEPDKGGDAVFYPGTAGDKRRRQAPVQVEIEDIRACKEQPVLDIQGFQLIKQASCEKNFDDEDRIKSIYHDECAQIVKRYTFATKVTVLNHVVRQIPWTQALEAEKHLQDNERFIGPSYGKFVHVDQSYRGAWHLLESAYSEDVPLARTCRWAIINLWRPINYPATNNALAVCDARSIPERHLRGFTAIFPKENAYETENERSRDQRRDSKQDGASGEDANRFYKRGEMETWAIVPPDYEGQHKWYYVSEMRPEEALLLKIFDSKKEGVARRSPHSSFTAQEDCGPERHSLECRCLVFWEDQPPE